MEIAIELSQMVEYDIDNVKVDIGEFYCDLCDRFVFVCIFFVRSYSAKFRVANFKLC
jgi:uncharacterized protein (UPF0212 family)